jgi:glycosyltransferase involved in cell wall biosynthesis
MWALRKFVATEKPQVAIGFMHSMFVPMTLGLLGTKVPVLASEHIVPEHYRTRPCQYAMFLLAAELAMGVTVLSESIRQLYPAMIRNKMIPMPNPVTFPRFRSNAKAKGKRHLLLNVGRLHPQKDQVVLLHAFSKIAPAYLDWDLKIVGEGPLRRVLEDLIRDLNLEGRVVMPGIISDLSEIYAGAELFVTSSRYESFGVATAEAMAFGLPTVGFADCPGTNELVAHGSTGLLAEAGNDRATVLANTLKCLMADSNLRRKFGTAAKAAVERNYSVARICDRWEALCTKCAARAANASLT